MTKALIDLPIGPGVYTEQTERGAVGRWRYADKVRFRKGLPEKIGGWIRLEPQFLGTCRRIKDWTSLDGRTWSALGTEKKLYLWQDNNLYDITPIRDSGVLAADPFTTTISTSVVSVSDPSHGAKAGDYVRFSGATVVGGLTISGEYSIASVTDQDTYTIVDDETATSSATGGGSAVAYEYDISAGVETVVSATGWNAGRYGTDRTGYNTPLVGSSNTLLIPIRTWSLDNWGEDLLACPRGGKIYWWDRSKGASTRAIELGGNAPQTNEAVIISQRDRHVIALGAYDYFNEAVDPLLIRWSSTEDLNDWIPTSTNTSGDLRLYSGSKIVTGLRSRLELIVFTDVSVHTLPFVGGFDVFGLNIVGENVSILGPNCAVAVDSRVFFMAEADFYIYDGIVRVLNCDVRNYVYDNLNVEQKDKIYGGLNREFNEIWWHYPSYDPDTWVQDTFELGLPPDYSIASTSTVTSLYNDVLFQADFEGANGATAYTEESQYAEAGTFFATAQLSTTTPVYDTSSLQVTSGSADKVRFPVAVPNQNDWDATGRVQTAEIAFYFDTLDLTATSWEDELLIVGDTDGGYLRMVVYHSSLSPSVCRFRAGFDQFFGLTPQVTLAAGVKYFLAIENDCRAGPGAGTERVWFGEVNSGVATLIDTTTGTDPSSNSNWIIEAGKSGAGGAKNTYRVDHARITNSATGRYTDATTTINIPDPYTTSGGSTGVAGYVYNFDPSGFTERVPTADNGYEHDFFLTNADPILTPTQSEYGVELDVSPDIGAGTGSAGLCFLRTNVTGAPNTDADDCNQWMVELNKAANAGVGEVRIYKKEAAAPAAPDNLVGSNTVNFNTLTGADMVTGQKYLVVVQFDTPQITVWVDGNQAFQFNMSAAELALFTSGTAGLHASPDTTGDQYRFYNFASGPVGTVSAADFDISPIENNRYVAFNYEENTWTTGKMVRTAWADRSPLLEKAYAAGTDGYLYQHETGTDANGVAMPAFIESFDFEIPQAGEDLMHVDQLVPDFLRLEGQVDLYLSGRKYPQDGNRITKGPYPVSTGVRKISTRLRARQVALRIESNTLGDRWRMGTIRGRVRAHGKRG